MRTRDFLRQLLVCLALLAGLPAGPAWAAGTAPQTLTWTGNRPGYQLQGRTSLGTDSPWRNVTTPPGEAAGEARVRLEEATPFRYFRLLKP